MSAYSPRFKQVASSGMLVLAALIWGMCFVAQRSGMEHIGPFLFNGLRELLGAATLLLVMLVFWIVARVRSKGTGSAHAHVELLPASQSEYGVNIEPGYHVQAVPNNRDAAGAKAAPGKIKLTGMQLVLVSGVLCGLALYFASNLQQVGMVYVTASKAAFITTLYIVLVPIFGLFLRQKTHWNTWVSVAIAVVGLYLLCVGDTLSLEFGDIILLVSALFWTIHILAVGHFAPRLKIMQLFGMCVVQFAFAGFLSLVSAPFFDHLFVAATPGLEAISYVMPEILYAGILSTAGGFTLAAIGQRYAKPAPAAVIMSLESAFGLLGGVVLLGESLTTGESIGCVLMFVAVILTQLEFKKPARRKIQATDASVPQIKDP